MNTEQMNIFTPSRSFFNISHLMNKISSCSVHPFLTSICILSLSLYISKGQMFPAVTVALHWYSALNLAKSQAAVSASSNHRAIWHRAHRGREEKAWRIKGTEKYGRKIARKGQTISHGRPTVTSSILLLAFYTTITHPKQIKNKL